MPSLFNLRDTRSSTPLVLIGMELICQLQNVGFLAQNGP